MERYNSSLEHLLDELRRIELLIRCQILRFRMTDQGGTDELRGLYIKEEEIDALLAEGSFTGAPHVRNCPQLSSLLEARVAMETAIAARKAASQRAGVPLRLARVQTLFHLSSFDVDTPLVCLAPELHRNYEKLYAYLQDDVTKKRPTVDLCLQLLCPSFDATLAARQRFAPSAPLVQHRLVHVVREPSQPAPSLLNLSLKADDKQTWRILLRQELAHQGGVTFLAGNTTWEPMHAVLDMPFVCLEFARPSYPERVRLWTKALDGMGVHAVQQALAGKFRLSGGQIQAAAVTARNLARWRDPDHGQVRLHDQTAACRLHSNRKLATLAQPITPHYTWDDMVLPADRLQQLREICHYVNYRAVVCDAWGFDRKLTLGKGLNVLFVGPSGTGKTMAAEIMASELGLELYKIDLSTVVSKYIGETEKNLARIFAEAETSNAILFFAEADALFGKRSEVRDAHDRYANIEIGYLLQKMEEYEGVVILATNLRKNMDEAFGRRMHMTVEFPFSSEKERRRIWERIWPADTPRSTELDLDFMAHRFEFAGGNIRNIALAAAFLAAADGGVVGMAHLLHATRREYQKMGKVVEEKAFREYSGVIMAR